MNHRVESVPPPNGLKFWKALGIICTSLIAAGTVLSWVSTRTTSAIKALVEEQIRTTRDSTWVRQEAVAQRLTRRLAALETRFDRQFRQVQRTQTLARTTLKSVLQKPSQPEKNRLLSQLGVDTSIAATKKP